MRPASCSCPMRSRMRAESSPAALRVKVRPRISPALTLPLASSQRTRFAIVSVLPLPAPAMTRAGASGDSMTAHCSAVGRGLWIASAMSCALTLGEVGLASVTAHRPHPVQLSTGNIEGAPPVEVDLAVERGLRHSDCRLPNPLAESLELVVVERCLDALPIQLGAQPLLHVEQLRTPAVVVTEFVEQFIEQALRIGELVDPELRMVVNLVLCRDR